MPLEAIIRRDVHHWNLLRSAQRKSCYLVNCILCQQIKCTHSQMKLLAVCKLAYTRSHSNEAIPGYLRRYMTRHSRLGT